MAEVDGVVRIATKITTKDAEESLASLEWKIKNSAKVMDGLRAKMDALKGQKIPTEQYKKLENDLAAAKKELDKLVEEQNKLESIGITFGSAWDTLNEKVAKASDSVDAIKAKMQQLVDAGKGFTLGENTAQYQELENQLKAEEAAVAQWAAHYKKLAGSVTERFEKMRQAAKKAFTAISGGTKKTGGLFSTFASRLKGIALSLLIFNWISKGFNAMVAGMKKGFENLTGYSNSYANSVQSMKNAMSTLGNQFAAAFSPIVQAVIPWLNQLIGALTTAMTYVAQFTAALTGADTFTRAKKIQDGYNKSLEGTAGAAKKAAGALARFDDLDVLQKKDNSAAEMLPADMFEEVPVSDKWKKLADNIKELLSGFFAPLKEAWENQGQFVMDSWRYALGEIGLLAQSVGRDFLAVWNQPETVEMLENILIIIGDIGLIVGNLAAGIRKAWEENGIGLSILQNIRDIFADIIGHIRNMADATVLWSATLDFSPLLKSVNTLLEALKPFMDNVGAGLEWFYTNVLLPLAGWVIEDAIPVFLDMLSGALEVLNSIVEVFKPLGKWLWDKFLEPIASWTGGVIVFVMEAIAAALTKIGDWITEHQAIVQAFTATLGIFAASWGIVNVGLTVFSVVGSIAAGIAGALSTAMGLLNTAITFITGPIGIAIFAISAMISAGILLYENWEVIKQKSGEFKDWVVNKFNSLLTWFSGLPEKFSEIGGNLIEGLKNGILGMWEKLKDTVGNVASSVIDKFKSILGIHSPSTVMEENGAYMMEGLENGISSGIESVYALFSPDTWYELGTQMFASLMTAVEEFKVLWLESFTIWQEENLEMFFGYDMWYEQWLNLLTAYNDVNAEFLTEWSSNINAWWKDMVMPFFEVSKWQQFGTNMKNGIMLGFKSIVSMIAGVLNHIITLFNAAYTQLQDAMNALIEDYNAKARIMGTATLSGVSYNPMPMLKVPELASGAVIRGGNPFLAILGDQPRGQTNVEAPLATIRQAVREELSNLNLGSDNVQIRGGVYLDGTRVGELTVDGSLSEMKRRGFNVDVLGVT